MNFLIPLKTSYYLYPCRQAARNPVPPAQRRCAGPAPGPPAGRRRSARGRGSAGKLSGNRGPPGSQMFAATGELRDCDRPSLLLRPQRRPGEADSVKQSDRPPAKRRRHDRKKPVPRGTGWSIAAPERWYSQSDGTARAQMRPESRLIPGMRGALHLAADSTWRRVPRGTEGKCKAPAPLHGGQIAVARLPEGR